MPTPFGKKLRDLRSRAGLSQDRLTERSGVSVRMISRYENIELLPKRETAERLAKALDLAPDEQADLLAAAGYRPDPPPGTAREHAPPRAEPLFQSRLVEAADKLAAAVRVHWKREVEHRQVLDPDPLAVRWQAETGLSDHWEVVLGSKSLGAQDVPDLSGKLEQIADVYRRVPSGRLVLLGKAGSGKTVLALRLVTDLLETRRSGEPVPVIFSLGSWDPAVDLRAWLAAQLLRDHPGLGQVLPDGSTLAAALVENDCILPVMDGFDEIAGGLVRDPLEKLNRTARMPLVLTSRAAEYREAVAESDVLTAAACIELTDLTVDDLADYLPLTTVRTSGDGAPLWQPVLDELRREERTAAGETLAAVFTTPLMVALARTIYSDAPTHNPAELLDEERFPAPAAVEAHLLGNLVPTVYRFRTEQRRFEPERAERWLGYLAHHLNRLGEHDLAWWRLGTSMRRPARVLAMSLALSLAFALVDSVLLGLLLGFDPIQFTAGVVVDLAAGAAIGIAHGLLAKYRGAAFEPSGIQIRLRGKRSAPRRSLARRFGIGFAAGVLLGLAYGVTREVARGLILGLDPRTVLSLVLVNSVLLALVFGFGAGTTYALMSIWERPLDLASVQSPAGLIRSSRRTVVVQALLFAPALALVVPGTVWALVELLQLLPPRFGEWHWSPAEGMVLGLYAAGFGSLGYVLGLSAWGQWAVFGRFWLPLTGRLPWAVPEFLDDAYRLGVLRRSGVVYQFRHARLQDHLAASYRSAGQR
ncbi:helix-turn-helix domain-containing protein [Glycomyces algeriensis]|uniref:HTH cro/C1-type domain-containing protein n=1 Tax=Glycomyces algeriensis TaxID=256037 RepID=A0A9W6GBW6_9ACTN|nr:helix-turn-helix domain-containing protein [Glycomyces algeriensis]MDA1365566.1 helix-turn-helix domain-containing protein [Glycomyces algeriensis]MDR7351254.1 transcriptional regulator with XRE-family HTH domain [Glycomyces algeriensis]GLI43967.1 hypothetical protein GALLR39Z86_38170 [Glycomyces algeriensis]